MTYHVQTFTAGGEHGSAHICDRWESAYEIASRAPAATLVQVTYDRADKRRNDPYVSVLSVWHNGRIVWAPGHLELT